MESVGEKMAQDFFNRKLKKKIKKTPGFSAQKKAMEANDYYSANGKKKIEIVDKTRLNKKANSGRS